jgi:hypothetical protein
MMAETAGEVGDAIRKMIEEEMARRDPLEQRIIANRVKLAIEYWIKAKQTSPRPIEAMTDQESLLYELEKMQFGKYEGQPIGDVPLDYLEWLADASRGTWRKIQSYLMSKRAKIRSKLEHVDDS